MLPGFVKTGAAIILLGVLMMTFVRLSRSQRHLDKDKGDQEILAFSIEGMKCSHCAESIGRALRESEGVGEAHVDFDNRKAVITGRGLNRDLLRRKIEELGYKALDDTGENPARQ